MFRTALLRAAPKQVSARMQQTRALACYAIYIKNLPLNITDSQVSSLVEKFGPIYECHIPENRPTDTYSVSFVKLYSGELPSSIEELAQLPSPTTDEIIDVTQRGNEAISFLDGYEYNGSTLASSPANKNNPDAIQFHARMSLRKATDPNFRAQTNQIGGTQYSKGYKDGFKDGYAKASSLINDKDAA